MARAKAAGRPGISTHARIRNTSLARAVGTNSHPSTSLDYGSANEVQLESIWHVPLQQLFTIHYSTPYNDSVLLLVIDTSLIRSVSYGGRQVASFYHFPNSPSIFHFAFPNYMFALKRCARLDMLGDAIHR